MASSISTIDKDEKELGVAVVDIGSGTTDIVVYLDGGVRHTGVIPIGSDSITNDIAVMLQVGKKEAEEIKKKLDETDEALLQLAITEIRQRFHSKSKEVYVPFIVDLGEDIKVTIPKLGDKKRVLELSERNAKYYRMERFKQVKITDPDRHVNRIMAQMKTDLQLKTEPRHIECFDNSNIQGTNPVAACVVFKNGKPSKKDYRLFNIKTVKL